MESWRGETPLLFCMFSSAPASSSARTVSSSSLVYFATRLSHSCSSSRYFCHGSSRAMAKWRGELP
eukprot:92325-Pyramimonas_sp.AAC.1